MKKKIGALFDLDGVLIDSETEYTRIWSAIDRKYPTGVKDFPLVIKGTTLPHILNTYFPESLHGAVTNMLNELEQQMKYEYLPGAVATLDYLEEHHIPRVLVTSSNDMKMRRLDQERPELRGRFDDIVTADRISHSKPDPEGYLLGAKLCGVDPANCVVCEDSVQGVMAGHAAGCLVIGLITTVTADKLEPYADIIVATLEEVNWDNIVTILSER